MAKRNNELLLEENIYLNYQGLLVDRRSTSRYCTFLGRNLMTLISQKQNVLFRSSAESEFSTTTQWVYELL